MKKWLPIFLAASIFSFTNENEEKAQELCMFTNEIFTILKDQSHSVDPDNLAKACASSIKLLQLYENGKNPELAALAEEFIASLQGDKESKEELGEAVSSLGRLVKCSVENEAFYKEGIQKELQYMEAQLGERLPKGDKINFHKLMIESRADQQYDIALYAYFKIAEERYYNSLRK